jgi:pimeloyl-ACP methyl ester carboxylesterase
VRRRWKIAIGLLLALAALLAVNTVVVNSETKGPEVTLDGGEILQLPGGAIQVAEQGPMVRSQRAGVPIVLIHCYSCSLHWWDRLAPLLAERHRVIRVDLLGHGGSEKPSGGYAIPEQAALIAGALSRRGIQGATVVGHSMGFTVTVAVAEQASQLVDRMVNIGAGPTVESCSIPLIARLAYAPVLGQGLWRITPDFAIEDGYESLFAADHDIEAGFVNPDQIVDDYRAMTFTSFAEARAGNNDYRSETPLDDRARAVAVPLMSVFGDEDEICDPITSQTAYETVPGARIETIPQTGHSPNIERPAHTARLIESFAAEGERSAARDRGAGD